MRYAPLLVLVMPVSPHAFVGNPPPIDWSIDIDKLIMPMNGDPNHYGPEWGQQKFPCKGLHSRAALEEPQVTWRAGEDVTFKSVSGLRTWSFFNHSVASTTPQTLPASECTTLVRRIQVAHASSHYLTTVG